MYVDIRPKPLGIGRALKMRILTQSPSRGCVGHRSLEYSKFADTQANYRLQYASSACARSLAPPHRHAIELRGAKEYGRRRTLGAVADGRQLHHVVLAHRFAHK